MRGEGESRDNEPCILMLSPEQPSGAGHLFHTLQSSNNACTSAFMHAIKLRLKYSVHVYRLISETAAIAFVQSTPEDVVLLSQKHYSKTVKKRST